MHQSTYINPIDLTHLYKELSHLFPPKIAKNNVFTCNFICFIFFETKFIHIKCYQY